jgi:hypothetical protein
VDEFKPLPYRAYARNWNRSATAPLMIVVLVAANANAKMNLAYNV